MGLVLGDIGYSVGDYTLGTSVVGTSTIRDGLGSATTLVTDIDGGDTLRSNSDGDSSEFFRGGEYVRGSTGGGKYKAQ